MDADTGALQPITSRAEFAAALMATLQASAARQARRMLWVDRDFSDWPLDDPALLQALEAWLRLPQRCLLLVADDFGAVARQHPRFIGWRRPWVHAVPAWCVAEAARSTLPSLALDDGPTCLHLHDKAVWRGEFGADAQAARRWRDEVDAALQHSTPALAANVLGL
ncbi:MAG: hypothetical protein Q8N44_06355 [Rubrivivax sp.]|nr:hypothetical protein [Rubrivivax sp.]MDP3083298.1 hypothetical protein [Rubrivivax sp.]